MDRTGGSFVGRTTELETLVAIGNGRELAAAVVVGDPGSGKTRLLAEACERIDGAVPFRVVGYEPERSVPLAAAAGLLDRLGGAGTEESMLRSFTQEDPAWNGEMDPLRLFEAAYQSLVGLDRAVITIDDLQWTDERTIALCHYLLRGAKTSGFPLALMAVSRPSTVASGFSDAVRQLLQPEELVEMELSPLSLEEGAELARRLAPELGRSQAEDLWAKAQGSPFWMETLARSHTGEEAERLLLSRLRGLGPDAAALFGLLSVAARPLGLRDLGELLSWEVDRIEAAANQVVNRGLVSHTGSNVRVAHDLIRDMAIGQIAPSEGEWLHRQIAEWLEREGENDTKLLLEAMEHRRLGRLPFLDLALRVASSPSRRLLGREGLLQLAALADEVELGPEQLRLQWEVASLASELGEREVAVERWDMLSERMPSPGERARAALSAAAAAQGLERAADAHVYIDRCRRLNEGDEILAIETDAREAQVMRWIENRNAEAKEFTRRAVEAARRLAQSAGGVDALQGDEHRAYVAALRAEFDAAVRDDDLQEAIRLADEMTPVVRLASEAVRVDLDVGFCSIIAGRSRDAEHRLRRAVEESRRHLVTEMLPEATFQLSTTLYNTGQLDEARSLANEAVSLAERLGTSDRYTLPDVQDLTNFIEYSTGDRRRALERKEELVAEATDPHTRILLRLYLAALSARVEPKERADLVREHLEEALRDAALAECERCRGELLVTGAGAFARIGALDRAQALLAEWDASHEELIPIQRLWRDSTEALMAAARGESEEAVHLFETAIEQADAIGQPMEALWSRIDLGRTLLAVDREGAVASLLETMEIAGRLGAVNERAEAEQLLRSLGVRTWRRKPADDGQDVLPLSERELQIARLVAEGASNPEVAKALFISRKTVERHISNILSKLEIRNRTELASKLPELISQN